MDVVDLLLGVLDLEKIDTDLWRGITPDTGRARVYGGQVIAQALVAAQRSVDGRKVHSLHGYFMLGGDPRLPILYEVDRIRDGRSFATRRVRAVQNGQEIFSLMASFHAQEPGLHHQFPMPKVTMPDQLPDDDAIVARYVPKLSPRRQAYWRMVRPIEVRPADPEAYFNRKPGEPFHDVWFKLARPANLPAPMHAVVLAFASDMSLLDGATIAHGKSVADADIMAASLDHTIWFHEDFRADEWLLYSQDSPWSGHARGLGRGLIFTQTGKLVASVAQEGLIRPV